MVYFQRSNNEGVKTQRLVRLPWVLSMSGDYYTLTGVVHHIGEEATGGHYVYWRRFDSKWIIFDDKDKFLYPQMFLPEFVQENVALASYQVLLAFDLRKR